MRTLRQRIVSSIAMCQTVRRRWTGKSDQHGDTLRVGIHAEQRRIARTVGVVSRFVVYAQFRTKQDRCRKDE